MLQLCHEGNWFHLKVSSVLGKQLADDPPSQHGSIQHNRSVPAKGILQDFKPSVSVAKHTVSQNKWC